VTKSQLDHHPEHHIQIAKVTIALIIVKMRVNCIFNLFEISLISVASSITPEREFFRSLARERSVMLVKHNKRARRYAE